MVAILTAHAYVLSTRPVFTGRVRKNMYGELQQEVALVPHHDGVAQPGPHPTEWRPVVLTTEADDATSQ